MSTLSAALEARDKAAPGPWQWIEYGDDLGCSYMADKDGEDLYAGNDARREETGKVAIAAPAALDWIAKALPFLRLSKHVHIPETRPELIDDPWDDELDTLIKEATE